MIELFKAFAGPVATILAATAAAFFAWNQKKLAEEKLRLDLFDRRYEAFETIFPFYNALVGWTSSEKDKEARTSFLLAYHQSGFLFGPEVEAIFKELREAGAKVIGFKENKEAYRDDPETMTKLLNETQLILVTLFEHKLLELKSKVGRYIDFSKTQVSPAKKPN